VNVLLLAIGTLRRDIAMLQSAFRSRASLVQRHCEAIAALDGAIAQIRKAGKVVAAAGDWDSVGATVEKGVQLLYIHANTLLKKGAGVYRKNARLQDSAPDRMLKTEGGTS
jgi:hypothetical protein